MKLLTTHGDYLLTSEHFRDKQWWVCIMSSVYGQERAARCLLGVVKELKENLIGSS